MASRKIRIAIITAVTSVVSTLALKVGLELDDATVATIAGAIVAMGYKAIDGIAVEDAALKSTGVGTEKTVVETTTPDGKLATVTTVQPAPVVPVLPVPIAPMSEVPK